VDQSRGYIYAGSNNVDEAAWYPKTEEDPGTKTVGTKAPNELGLYDLSGNVVEWCWDWNGNYQSGSQMNPTGATSGSARVTRGSSLVSGLYAPSAPSSGRNGRQPDYVYGYPGIGFRLVRTLVH